MYLLINLMRKNVILMDIFDKGHVRIQEGSKRGQGNAIPPPLPRIVWADFLLYCERQKRGEK